MHRHASSSITNLQRRIAFSRAQRTPTAVAQSGRLHRLPPV